MVMAGRRVVWGLLFGWVCFAAMTSRAAEGDEKEAIEKLNGKIPFVIVHFVTGYQKAEEGCPSVMISNGKARGMVVWSKAPEPGKEVRKLIEAIEKSGIDNEHCQVHLTVFDSTPEKVKEQVKDWGLKEVLAGSARWKSEQVYKQHKIDPELETIVFLADGRDLKRIWLMKGEEFDEKREAEIEKAAKAFLKDEEK